MPSVTHASRPLFACRVAVVGSANLDIVVEVDAAPRAGETVLGSAFSEHGGGKGLNQAIASAALAPTAFVGSLGRDEAGDRLLEHMRANGVYVDQLRRSDLPSGRAFITLTPDAENSIVVIAGANRALERTAVTSALDALTPVVVLAQHEIAADAVEAAATWATANRHRFAFNASPVGSIARSVLSAADPLIVNADEAREILRSHRQVAEGIDERALAERLCDVSRSVIVTAGKNGAYVARRGAEVQHVPATTVTAVDTTGAGDAFAGTVAACLALGASLEQAAHTAGRAGAELVAQSRADRMQNSFPSGSASTTQVTFSSS